MKVDWAILCNAAEVRDGLAFVLGAGWDTAYREHYPATFWGSILVRTLFASEEAGRPHQCRLVFVDKAGTEIAESITLELMASPERDLPLDWDLQLTTAVNLIGLPIPGPGQYAIEVWSGDELLRSIAFQFVEGHAPSS